MLMLNLVCFGSLVPLSECIHGRSLGWHVPLTRAVCEAIVQMCFPSGLTFVLNNTDCAAPFFTPITHTGLRGCIQTVLSIPIPV